MVVDIRQNQNEQIGSLSILNISIRLYKVYYLANYNCIDKLG